MVTARTVLKAGANRGVAVRDAGALMGRLRLPAGSLRSKYEPRGDGAVLAAAAMDPAPTSSLVDLHRWWRVRTGAHSVLAFIRSHPPGGAKVYVIGSTGGAGRPQSSIVAYAWRPITGGLGNRWLVVQVVALPGGSTGVRADAEVVWIIPRSPSERIPAGVGELDVTRAAPGQLPSLSVSFTDLRKIRVIVSIIDRLPIVQPSAIACPAVLAGAPVVTFTFRARTGRPALARASELAYASDPATACGPMSFSIRGRLQTPLLAGGPVLVRAQRVLGLKLAIPVETNLVDGGPSTQTAERGAG